MIKRYLAALVAMTMLVAACGNDDDDSSGDGRNEEDAALMAPLTERKALTVGSLTSISLAPLYIALSKGYFADEMLDVKLESVPSSQEGQALLARGQLDAIAGSLSAGFFNGLANDLDVKQVSSLGQVPKSGTAPSGLYVRKQLHDNGSITKVADLKGKKIASIGGLGGAVSFLVAEFLKQGDLELKDVELVNVPGGNAGQLTALQNGAVDVAYLTAPFSTTAVSAGDAVAVGDSNKAQSPWTQSGMLFGPNLLVEDPQAGVAFIRALVRASSEDLQGDYRTRPDVVAALTTIGGLTADLVRTTPLYSFHPELQINQETAEEMQDIFREVGGLLQYEKNFTSAEVFDTRLHALAVQSFEDSK